MQGYGAPPLRQATVPAVASRIVHLPSAPASLSRLATELSSGLFAAAAISSGRAALADLRASLFTAYGHERAARALWHESLATAACADMLARINGAPLAVAVLAGLLHRAGDACALHTLSRLESWGGVRLEASSRARIAPQQALGYAERLSGEWQLPEAVAACVTEWHRCPELDVPPRESAAVYCGRLLALQILQPQLCAPGAVEAAASEYGFSAEALARLHAPAERVRELLRTFD
jgi:HD-like signal output (HDOD) protein